MSQVQPRKIFNADNWQESRITENLKTDCYTNTISAAGCLFRKGDKGLLIKYRDPGWPKLDDFGGQVDHGDASPLETIIREVVEETNGVISRQMMVDMLALGYKTHYNNYSKYYGVIIDVPDDFFQDTSVFGEIELVDNIYRTVNWYNFSEVKDSLCYRLTSFTKTGEYL